MADFESNFEIAWEPEQWFVTFHTGTTRGWVRALNRRFKHVTAFGYVAGAKSWVFVDVLASRMRVRVAADQFASALLGEQSALGVVVKMPPKEIPFEKVRLKWGLWCVPVVAHIVGLGASALRPDALYRQCLANGGEILAGHGDHEIRHENGPVDHATAEGC